jgi:hypothetical protein
MTWACLVFGCKEVTIDLREDPLSQVIGWGDTVLIETKRCVRCGEERKIRSIGRVR